MIHDVIEIDKELIPYEFDILLADETFKIGINYNNTAELFVLSLSKLDEDTGEYVEICVGEPIIYGQELWKDLYISSKYPSLSIVPIDESKESDSVTYDNFNRTIYLIIDNGDDEVNE